MITMASLIQFLKSNGITYREGKWQNFSKNVDSLEKSIVVQVDKNQQVASLIKKITEINTATDSGEKLVLRAVSGWEDRYSSTPLCAFFKKCWGTEEDIVEKYNESYSFTFATVANVYLRFSPKFQEDLNIEESNGQALVTVPSGTQVEKLADWLWEKGYSLPTSSMIRYVSAVGLAANAGHGTGKNQGSFCELIDEIKICL